MYIHCIGLKELFKATTFKKKNNSCRVIFIPCYVRPSTLANGSAPFEFAKALLEIETQIITMIETLM